MRLTLTNVPWSPFSWCFVCVFLFCRRADGNASRSEHVVMTTFSYASIKCSTWHPIYLEDLTDNLQVPHAHTARRLRLFLHPLEGKAGSRNRGRTTTSLLFGKSPSSIRRDKRSNLFCEHLRTYRVNQESWKKQVNNKSTRRLCSTFKQIKTFCLIKS